MVRGLLVVMVHLLLLLLEVLLMLQLLCEVLLLRGHLLLQLRLRLGDLRGARCRLDRLLRLLGDLVHVLDHGQPVADGVGGVLLRWVV